jgi:hypothetical protein
MAARDTIHSGVATQEQPVDERDDFGIVLDEARSLISQEFQIAERLDAKARNQMTVAAAWYGVVQATAAVVLRGPDALTLGDGWYTAILGLGGLAGIAFLSTLGLSFLVWRTRDEEDVSPTGLGQMGAVARDPSADFAADLLEHYRDILTGRRANNEVRDVWFRRSQLAWVICVGLTSVELFITLTALFVALS